MVEEPQRVGGTRPLDEESWKALPELLQGLRMAMTNITFYPAGSEQVTMAVESAYSHLARTLESNRSLILAESEGMLLANGQPLREDKARKMAGVFLQSLIDCGIKSVTFKQGLDLDEFFVFMKGLGEKKWKREKDVVISDRLEESRIYHIGIDEKIYVPIGDGDLVIEKAKDILARSGGRIDEIMKAIDEAAEMMGAVEDEAARDKIREEIAKRFLEMDPAAFADMLKREDIGEVRALTDQAVSSFSHKKIREIVAELSKTYINLKKSATAGSPEAMEMERIKEVIKKILALCGEDIISIKVFRELVSEGLLDKVVKWEDVRAEENLLARAEKITHCDPTELVTPEAVRQIRRTLAELKIEEEEELAIRIMDTIAEGLSSPTADIRLKAARAIESLSAEIASYGSKEMDTRLEKVIINFEEKETDPRVYRVLGRQLSDLAKKFIRQFDFQEAKRAVSMFRKHKRETGLGFPERSELAMGELMWIGDEEIARLLLAELKSEDQSRREAAHDIVMRLEEVIVRHIVNAMKETEELPQRKYLASILEEFGEEAVARLVEEIESDMSVTSTTRLMELLDGMDRPEIALEQLRRLLSHPHPQVRHEAIGTLKRFGGGTAGEIIIRGLEDRNFYVLRYAVQAIGDTGYREAADRLIVLSRIKKGLSTEEKDALLEEICVSLGKLQDSRAVPFLATVARSRMVAGILKRGYSRNVRVAAIRALGRFATDEAREAIELLRKEKDSVIRSAAISALSS